MWSGSTELGKKVNEKFTELCSCGHTYNGAKSSTYSTYELDTLEIIKKITAII